MWRGNKHKGLNKHEGLDVTQQALLHLARLKLRPEDTAFLEQVAEQIDWANLLRFSTRAGITGLLNKNLGDLPPRDVKKAFVAKTLAIEVANRTLITCFRDLCAIANQRGVPFVPLKGTAFYLGLLYDSFGLRRQVDIDVLTPYAHLDEVERLLFDAGFVSWGDRNYSLEHQHHLKYTREMPTGKISVEVHWTLFFKPYATVAMDAGVFDRLRTLTVDGLTVHHLDMADTYLFGAIHLGMHRYREQFKWLVDLSEIAHRYGAELDWNAVWKRADALRARRCVAHATALAIDLLDAPIAAPPLNWRHTLLRRACPIQTTICGETQPSLTKRALIDVLQSDSLVRGARRLLLKHRELKDRAGLG